MTSTTFRIGDELTVRRLGFGAMRLRPDETVGREACVAVARRAVELGVTLIDTAHLYGWGANEELLAEALHPYPDDLLIATKVGVAPADPPQDGVICGRPEFLRDQVEQGLRRLRLDRLDLLQLHRIDPTVPLADQLGTLRELQVQGKIGHIGLSEVTVDELAQARQIIDVASVQNRYSMVDREHEPVLDACATAGIAFLPWRPVHPAVSATATEITAVAAELGATAAQVSLAWLLDRSPVILPIPGTRSIRHLEENVAAAGLRLTDDQRLRLTTAASSAPTRPRRG
ncbi:aldo/keto reductase [Alloactinosynnema sp. L-07]|uniref:aldo/keto reductase n=1 Tax=Alloactinosynnema sp. L-07 TaxID=1653480 RepID=UPI0006B5660C|nr:aldo/keto reductase [Alloactinosynnema sp. L-07]